MPPPRPTVAPAAKAPPSVRCVVAPLLLHSMARCPLAAHGLGGQRQSGRRGASVVRPLACLLARDAAALIVGEPTQGRVRWAHQRDALRGGDVVGAEPRPTAATTDHGVLIARDAAAGRVTLRREERRGWQVESAEEWHGRLLLSVRRVLDWVPHERGGARAPAERLPVPYG